MEYGLANKQGKIIVKEKYFRIYDATQHGVFVAVEKDRTIKLLHPQTGKVLQNGKSLKLTEGYNGNNCLILKEGNYFKLYNFKLQPINSQKYYHVKISFVNIHYILAAEDRTWGVLNDKGETVIMPQYSNIDFETTSDNRDLFPTNGLFRVSINYGEAFYVNEQNELQYGATGNTCCALGKGDEAMYLARRYFLLQNINKLKGREKTVLGTTYQTTEKSINNPAEAYKWYREGWLEEKTGEYTTLKLADFLQRHPAFSFYDTTIKAIDLFYSAASKQPFYYIDVANYYYNNDMLDTAAHYYNKAISLTGYNSYAHINANIGLAKIFYKKKNTGLTTLHIQKAKVAATANHTKVYDHMLGELSDLKLAYDNLSYGMVINYQGEKVMVLHKTLNGIELSNGKYLPPSAINYTILKGESTAQFMTKCLACAGTGMVNKTFTTPYAVSYSKSELRTGSTISGDYIKTTTYTTPSTYQGQEACSVCYGSKNVIKKTGK